MMRRSEPRAGAVPAAKAGTAAAMAVNSRMENRRLFGIGTHLVWLITVQ